MVGWLEDDYIVSFSTKKVFHLEAATSNLDFQCDTYPCEQNLLRFCKESREVDMLKLRVVSKTLRINFVGAKSRAKLTDLASWSPRNETRRLTRPGRSVKGSSTIWEAWWVHPVGIGCCHNYPISKRVGVDTIAFTWELSKISFSAVYIKSPGTYIEYERKVLPLNHRKTKMKNDHGQGLLHRDLGAKRSSDRDYSYLCHSQQTTCLHTDRNQKSDNDKKLQPYDKQSNVQISKHTFLADNIYMLI